MSTRLQTGLLDRNLPPLDRSMMGDDLERLAGPLLRVTHRDSLPAAERI
jgi:hypothetical protein